MAATIQQLFYDARALLNTYSEDGVLIAEDDVIDLQLRFIRFADMAHKELFEIARVDETQESPTTIDSLDDETEVNYKADLAITYWGAAKLAAFKKKELVQYFEDMYLAQKKLCANKAVIVTITDVYIEEETEE